jgi:dTDP-4-dehydrorhamnose reductase
MKFLILGCNGMAGHTISLYLKEKGHQVMGFDRLKSDFIKSIAGDARNLDLLKNIIETGKYDTVINCIGILNQDAENNKSLSVFLNSFLPHYLVDITKNMNTQIIQMSTDCVFSGERGQYTESDFKDGKTFYDRTKALGEINDNKNVTLRNSIIGPDININGIGLLNWFMMQNESIYGYTKAIWSGQTTLQLAKTMEYVAINRVYGLFNSVPENPISKYDLLKLLNKHFKNGQILIKPVEGVSLDKSLKRTNYSMDYIIPEYEIMIKELHEWMARHKDLYKHYSL